MPVGQLALVAAVPSWSLTATKALLIKLSSMHTANRYIELSDSAHDSMAHEPVAGVHMARLVARHEEAAKLSAPELHVTQSRR